MNSRHFASLAVTALLALAACADGEDLPVECRSNADCEVGNCLETICTGSSVGGPSQQPGTPGSDVATADVSDTSSADVVDAGSADADTDADANIDDTADAQADVEEDIAVTTCDDLVVSANSLVVTPQGARINVRNDSNAATIVSIISASPVSIFRVTSPSNTRLPISLNPGASFAVELESVAGETGTGVLEITTGACLLSISLATS